MEGFVSGCLSGFSQIIMGHPLDTYKTWLQQGRHIPTPRVHSLYRGIRYPLASNCLVNGVLFGTNTVVTKYLPNQWLSGALTGVAMGIVCTPVELYKIREQCKITTKYTTGRSSNPSLVDRIRINYRGFVPTMCRETLSCSIYFGTYHYLYHNNNYNVSSFWSGGAAGVACWALVHPIDTIKTRIQVGQFDTILMAIRAGGLWNGLAFSCSRAFLVNSIGYWVYQTSINYLTAP